MARLGHEDIKTTLNVYGHLFPSLEASLADALDAHLAPAQLAGDGGAEVVSLSRA